MPADPDDDSLQQATIWVISYSDNLGDQAGKPASLSFEVGGFRYEARMTGVTFGADFPGDLPIRPGREGYRVSLAVTNLQTDRIAGRPFEFQLYARISAVAPADCELVRTHDLTGPDGDTYCELRDTEVSSGLASGNVFSARQTVTWVLGNRPGNSIPEGSLRPADLLVLAHIGDVIPDQQFGFLPQLSG